MRNSFKSRFFGSIIYLLGTQALTLLLLALISLFFYFDAIYPHIKELGLENLTSRTLNSFLLSLKFNNFVVAKLFLPMFVIIPALAFFNLLSKTIVRLSNLYFILSISVLFIIAWADIPYFNYFNRHIDTSIFHWAEDGDASLGMIFSEKSYIKYILLCILMIGAFSFALIKGSKTLFKRFDNTDKQTLPAIFLWTLSLLACYVGAMGSIKMTPLRFTDGYTDNNSMINQIAITSLFYLHESTLYTEKDYAIAFFENEKAIELASGYLNKDLNKIDLTQSIPTDTVNELAKNPNIVIIFMESLSSQYLDIKNGSEPLLPTISILSQKSYFFPNLYSQGTHTNQGIVAGLYGFPSVLDQHMTRMVDKSNKDRQERKNIFNLLKISKPSQNLDSRIIMGLPQNLKEKGYSTTYYMTNNWEFDSMGAFLAKNGFDKSYSRADYPKDEVVNMWGVSDMFLMKFMLEKTNATDTPNAPFLSVIQTISNHPPYVYPKEFDRYKNEDDEKAMAYADSCLDYFFKEAEKSSWYENTIFVIVGDHGVVKGASPYDVNLTLNHIPLIIYSPMFENEAATSLNLGGQIDIYPTIMGLIGGKAKYNIFGQDLLKTKREYIYFSTDDKLGCVSDSSLYVYGTKSGMEFLYDLNRKQTINDTKLKDSMKTYSGSILQSASYILRK